MGMEINYKCRAGDFDSFRVVEAGRCFLVVSFSNSLKTRTGLITLAYPEVSCNYKILVEVFKKFLKIMSIFWVVFFFGNTLWFFLGLIFISDKVENS